MILLKQLGFGGPFLLLLLLSALDCGEDWGDFADVSDREETVWVLSPYLLTVVSAGSAKPTF